MVNDFALMPDFSGMKHRSMHILIPVAVFPAEVKSIGNRTVAAHLRKCFGLQNVSNIT